MEVKTSKARTAGACCSTIYTTFTFCTTKWTPKCLVFLHLPNIVSQMMMQRLEILFLQSGAAYEHWQQHQLNRWTTIYKASNIAALVPRSPFLSSRIVTMATQLQHLPSRKQTVIRWLSKVWEQSFVFTLLLLPLHGSIYETWGLSTVQTSYCRNQKGKHTVDLQYGYAHGFEDWSQVRTSFHILQRYTEMVFPQCVQVDVSWVSSFQQMPFHILHKHGPGDHACVNAFA